MSKAVGMDINWHASIWRQFRAAIDMLDHALRACPDELWQERLYNERSVQPDFAEFWYVAYHALFWLDFYLSDSAKGFTPPAPFTLSELEAGALPDRVFMKVELQSYLEHGRNKCRAKLESVAELPSQTGLPYPQAARHCLSLTYAVLPWPSAAAVQSTKSFGVDCLENDNDHERTYPDSA